MTKGIPIISDGSELLQELRKITPHKGGRTKRMEVRLTKKAERKLWKIAESLEGNRQDAIDYLITEYVLK